MAARWSESVIWWQVFPLGFAGAPAESRPDQPLVHRLPGERWLDHLIDLGCNGLALGPVFASQSHGYDTVDHLAVDPRLGDADDLRRLFAACRERGVRVLLDGVFNHVGRAHPLVSAALAAGPGSEAGHWVSWHLDEDGGPAPDVFEGHTQLVGLNHAHPAVADLVVEVMDHWLSAGADGWRLDAAYAVPASFWASVLPRVRARHPEAWFVGEVIHGDYADYATTSTLDSITQYELWKAIWSSLHDRNFYELDWTVRRNADLLETFVPLTFLGNHDVTRIASQLGDPRLVPAAVALLCVLPGVPSVYYGDEYGLEAVKEERLGGDDAIRPRFPADPAAVADTLGTPVDHGVEDTYRTLVSVRRRRPWLVDASIRSEHLSNENLALVACARRGPERLALLLNSAESEAVIDLDGAWTVLERSPGDPDRATGVVPGFGWTVLDGA